MQDNLFSNIFKFTPKEITPLENFCTEIFVYILRQLIDKKNKKAQKILELFGFNKLSEKDFEHISVVTREQHYSKTNNKDVFPDIIISLRNKNAIIEVKVESGLRKYSKPKKQTIDQIELYKSITDLKNYEVFSLSKYVLYSSSLDNSNKILWSQIHSILKDDKNEIVNNFARFLEDKGMNSSIVEKGVEKAVDSLSTILSLIENSWTNEKYKLKDGTWKDCIGFYLKDQNTAWIGQLKEKNEYIVFQALDNLAKKAENIKGENMELDDNGNYIFAKIKFSEITQYKTAEEQTKRLQKWINDEINPLLK